MIRLRTWLRRDRKLTVERRSEGKSDQGIRSVAAATLVSVADSESGLPLAELARYGRLVHVQSGSELFLESREFPRKFGSSMKRLTHLNKSADDEHLDSRSPDRSPVSQTGNAVHPTASPHVVFI